MSSIAPNRTKAHWVSDVKSMLGVALEEATEICSNNDDWTLPGSDMHKHTDQLIDYCSGLRSNVAEPDDIHATPDGAIVFAWRKKGLMLDAFITIDGVVKNFFNFGAGMENSIGLAELGKALAKYTVA
jgi:hypothetical protein